MEEYINILRGDSIYIKLQSENKFGGAIDINSLVKALNSLNQSYKNFLEIELSKNSDVHTTTKKGKQELSNFIAESELLIVDLDFASFGAAISPNTATTHHYNNIKNSHQLKRESFNLFKSDVLDANYNDKDFIERITNKYTTEERNEIYKPIINNLINSSSFKFYYGDTKQTLRNLNSNLRVSAIEKILEKQLPPKSEPKKDEEVFVMYVTSSEEMDLFGKKPKYSKILATTKLDKPVYPYQLNEIRLDNYVIHLKSTLSAEVIYDEDLYFIIYPDLNIEIWGDDRQEAECAFNFALKSIVRNIYFENDENLTKRAILLKDHLNMIIKSIN